jgi:hypothetical protein
VLPPPSAPSVEESATLLGVTALQTDIAQLAGVTRVVLSSLLQDMGEAQARPLKDLVVLVFAAHDATSRAAQAAAQMLRPRGRHSRSARGELSTLYAKALALQSEVNARLARAEAQRNAGASADDALRRARGRGADYRSSTLARPDMLSGQEVAKRLRVTRQAVAKKRAAGDLFALSWGSRKLRYPAWQLEPSVLGDPLKNVLAVLGREDPWAVYRWFTTPEAAFSDETPLDALIAGRAEDVLKAARAYADRA